MSDGRNINPIPIHEPSGLGGTADLLTITGASILSFRNWVGEYKKRLLAAHDEVGQDHYITVNGHQCYKPIYEMDGYAEDKESACGKFLELLGFTDENYSELADIWDNDDVEHIHYIWNPQYGFSEQDFIFFRDMLQGEMSGVDKIVLYHTASAYRTDEFPNEPEREAKSLQQIAYDILKEDHYGCLDITNCPDPWTNWDALGKFKLTEPALLSGLTLEFLDNTGTPIVKPTWVQSGIMSLLLVSLNEAVTHLSVTKESEQLIPLDPGPPIGPPGPWLPSDDVYSITVREVMDLNFAACTYDRYYICDEEDCYKPEDELISGWAPYYINLFWMAREEVIEPENPINNHIGMFESDGSEYFMRVDFEHYVTPDEIAYLISNFSYIEIEEKEKKGGFIRGIIRAIVFVFGGFLFFTGFTGSATFLWKMATTAIRVIGRGLIKAEYKEMYMQMMAEAEAIQKQAMEQAQLEAAIENRTDISYNYDFWDKFETKNPYELGVYNPLSKSSVRENPYTVGGEFWKPHLKLNNEREIL